MDIRRAGNGDIDDVVHVIKAVYDEYGMGWFPDSYHRDLYDIERYYDAAGDEFYVAYTDGQPVGTVALEVFDPLPEGIADPLVRIAGCDCSVERLYVHPNGRRRGLAEAMMRFIMDRARARERTRMEVWSDESFTAAHALYNKIGAELVSRRLCDDPDSSPEFGLVLSLV